MIKALVLDFDGLILDTETPFRESWREIYAEHGLTVTPEAWASLLGSSSDPPEAYELLEQHLSRSVDRKGIHARRLARELELRGTEVWLAFTGSEEVDHRGIKTLIARVPALRRARFIVLEGGRGGSALLPCGGGDDQALPAG